MECKKPQNLERCGCTYTACGNRGVCCDCIAQHLAARQVPGCCFPAEAEKTYDRSFEAFTEAWSLKA